MTRTTLCSLIAVCLPVATALAAPENSETNSYSQNSETESRLQNNETKPDLLFRAGEFSLDIFGTGSTSEETLENISADRIEDDGQLGIGIGANYFFSRYLGVGIDAYSEDSDGPFIDNTSANLIFRIPIDSIHLAPYVYGGGGYQFDPGEVWFGQVGAGLEFRICPHVGLFADARYVMTDRIENFGVGRFGLRFVF